MINPYVINIIIIIYIETTVYKCFMMFNIKDTTNQQQKKEKKELSERTTIIPPAPRGPSSFSLSFLSQRDGIKKCFCFLTAHFLTSHGLSRY